MLKIKLKKIIKIKLLVISKLFMMINKKEKNKYIFCSKHGFTDNAKHLCLHYAKNGFDCIWVADKSLDRNIIPNNIKIVEKKSFELYFLLFEAKYVFITHNYDDLGWYMPKLCPVVNLWHGVVMKKMGYDYASDVKKLGLDIYNPYKSNDYVIASSEYTKQFICSCMNIPEARVLALGQPKADFLFKSSGGLNTKISKKVFLYAPTYRDNSNSVPIYMRLIESFNKFASRDSYLILRLHPNEKNLIKLEFLPENILLSTEEDSHEDLLKCDVLISDYSSMIFDFLILKRPVVLYIPDKEEYIGYRNDFYYSYDEVFSNFKKYDLNSIDDSWSCDDNNSLDFDVDRFNISNGCDNIMKGFL